jgi:hypothetical protein
VSKEYAKWGKLVRTRCEVVTATYLNTSGIIGAAYAAGAHVLGPAVAGTDGAAVQPAPGAGVASRRS